MSIDDESSTFCNESWDKFHKRTEIAKSELWNPHMVSYYFRSVIAVFYPHRLMNGKKFLLIVSFEIKINHQKLVNFLP